MSQGLLACAALFSLALCAGYPLLSAQRGRRRAGVASLWLVLLPAPWLIPLEEPSARLVRFLVAVAAVLFTWKLYDLHRRQAAQGTPGWRAYLVFMLSPAGHAVYGRRGAEPAGSRAEELRRLALGVVEAGLGGGLVAWLWGVFRGGAGGFWIEHCALWLALYAAFDGAIRILVALTRLAGGDAMEIYRDPILSRTPAEFWRRYNRLVNEWLFVNVTRRGWLRRHPTWGVVAAFAASALMHEYLFFMALGRAQGYQAAFFLLHGAVVGATWRWKPRGGAAWLGRALTIAFVLGSLVIFTASCDEVLQPLGGWYAHPRPRLWAD